jgi:hypothetical protein
MPAHQHQQEHKPTTTTATEAPTSTSSSTSTQFSSHGAIPPASQEGGAMLPPKSASQQAFGGDDMSGVQAHTNSGATAASAAVGAHAYAQGGNVHLGGAQADTLPHEAWHVVQQAEGKKSPPQM